MAPENPLVDVPGPDGTIVVGLLYEEQAGVISTRNAGRVEFEASLEWPPETEARTSVVPLLPGCDEKIIRSSLRESASPHLTMVHGSLSGFEAETLGAVVEETLHAVASVAAVREAVLRTRVLRTSRTWYPETGSVQVLAVRLREAGIRVGFGGSWSPAIPGADVMLGCQGARREIVCALESGTGQGKPVDSIGAAG